MIQIVYVSSRTFLGFSFYLFCCVYSKYGFSVSLEKNTFLSSYFLAAIWVACVMFLALFLWLCAKIPFTRRFLDNLVTPEYVLKYMGKFTGTTNIARIILASGGVTLGCEVLTGDWGPGSRAHQVEQVRAEFEEKIEISKEVYKDNPKGLAKSIQKALKTKDKQLEFIRKQPIRSGIVTKALNTAEKVASSETWNEAWKSIGKCSPFQKK